jgi:hypothetical protein
MQSVKSAAGNTWHLDFFIADTATPGAISATTEEIAQITLGKALPTLQCDPYLLMAIHGTSACLTLALLA